MMISARAVVFACRIRSIAGYGKNPIGGKLYCNVQCAGEAPKDDEEGA